MSTTDTEQNKTEEATPFKLKRARDKGTVARSVELGFFSCLVAFALYALAAGPHAMQALTRVMQRTLIATGEAADPQQALNIALSAYPPALQSVALLGVTIVLIVAFLEIVQVRGIVFTAAPLKPDFSRLNPAKGLKRLFTIRMLKETLKSVVKFAAYAAVGYLVLRHGFNEGGRAITDARSLGDALRAGGMRLLSGFALLALIFAALDQVLARGEFRKQMRMSRRELTREHREREGEPRLKQKRKQLHAAFAKQVRAISALPGSDLIVVNPEHFAVALRYDSQTMQAPQVTAKGRNHFALEMKRRAAVFSIPVFEQPALARALFRERDIGQEVAAKEYRQVADLYLKLATLKTRNAHAVS